MCLIEVWTFPECGCRFDHHVPCHPRFSRYNSPAQAQNGQIQPLPATPPPSRSADDGDYAWSCYSSEEGSRRCSIRHIENRVFREPICDDCLLGEIGINKEPGEVVESIENGLDGEEWLLESKVEIQIDESDHTRDGGKSPKDLVDDMPTPRLGTGFESLGDGDADDEGELDENFRGRSNRRSAIDINREHFGMASSWSNFDCKPQNLSKERLSRRSSFRQSKTARSLVRKVKDAELKSFAEKAKRGLRLTIDRAMTTASKARSDTSRSPTKTEWDSASSTVHTPTVVAKVRCDPDVRILRPNDTAHKHEETIGVRRAHSATEDNLTALPGCADSYQVIASAISIPPESENDDSNTTPTSISSSAVCSLAETSPTKWEDHLRQDLGERVVKPACSPIPVGNKADVHFDTGDERRRLLSTDTAQSSALTGSEGSSGNWVGLCDGQRLDDELAGTDFDGQDECRRLLSTTTVQSSSDTPSSATQDVFPREIPTADMDCSITESARPLSHGQGHVHRASASVSSIASFTTAFSPSPQTSPPRPSPRIRQNGTLSFHPLATMLQISTPRRESWAVRNSSLHSPPLSSEYRVGLESPCRSPTQEFVCILEREGCAICGAFVGGGGVVSCICESGGLDCQAEEPVVRKKVGMEVCDRCAGGR